MAGIDLSKIKKVEPQAKKQESSAGLLDFLNKDIQLFGSQLDDKRKESFYLELSILLTAGVDIKTTLELIVEEQTKDKHKKLFGDLKDAIIKGSTLSDAIKASNQFSLYEFYSVQIGEESGKLPIVLKELADYFQKKIKQRRQIISALTYPTIVLCASLGAVFFMMNFIVPMFADVFKRFGGELPFVTRVILDASNGIKTYFWLFILSMIGVFLFVSTQRKNLWFRQITSKAILKVPIMGKMIRRIYLARFCHSMTLLISSKIPLLRSITMVRQMIGFYPIEESLLEVEAQILKGNSLNNSLGAFSIYPKRMISLIKVGEEVNQLDVFFDKISKQFNDDIEHQTSVISSLIEPFMIIFLGLVVGVILIAMYLPLFNLSSAF